MGGEAAHRGGGARRGRRLVHLGTVRTDDEIAAALAPYVEGRCWSGIDAPLVVRNATGSRPAEQALSKDFRAFEAGTHPSNTNKAEFADGHTRGARVAKRLGLDMDPRSGRERRAIEVYPHPAIVVLFRLGRTLKYKNKPGRDLAELRSELLALMGHLEGVISPDQAWRLLRSQVEAATRKSELRVAEDQVDAVVAAYVALYADRHPELTTTYGDFETGYIVTPTLPDGQAAAPRVPRAKRPPADPVTAYATQHPELTRAAEQWTALVTSILDDAGINYLTVTGRAKTISSFAAKAARVENGEPSFTDPLTEITDQIGVRVITYVHSDVAAVVDLLGDQVVIHDDRDMGRETASEGRFGYASRHLLVGLDAPASTCRRTRRCAGVGRRCRSAPSCSTPGRSSSTTSATRAPSPTSTCRTSTGASPWPPGCWSSRTASSRRSGTGSRPA